MSRKQRSERFPHIHHRNHGRECGRQGAGAEWRGHLGYRCNYQLLAREAVVQPSANGRAPHLEEPANRDNRMQEQETVEDGEERQ